MKQFAYFKITDDLTAKAVSDAFLTSKEEGFENIIVLHSHSGNLRSAKYKEKLLMVLRGAYRHKMSVYFADDCYAFSGTAFGAVSSVKDMWQKELCKLAPHQVDENTLVLEEGDSVVSVKYGEENDLFPYKHYPDLTNENVAEMIIDEVYKPLIREFDKFKGYEFKGFISLKPMINSLKGIVYSQNAVKEYGKTLLPLFEKGKEYEKYMAIVEKCIEKSFITKLKLFCRDNNLEYLICGGENSLGEESLRQSAYSITDTVGKGYLMWADTIKEVTKAGLNKMGAVMHIHPAMKKMETIRSFLEELPLNCPVSEVGDEKKFSDRLLLTNMTDKEKTVCLLIENACIYDFEKKELYPLEKTQYTFYPGSFLYIIKKKPDMYIDALPACVGGVRIGEKAEDTEIDFVKKDNACGFYLPEDSLNGKCIEFEGDFEYLYVRLGSMENVLVQKPFAMPLYGFLQGARGGVEAYGGEVKKIKIN